jgi:hypothetical protein
MSMRPMGRCLVCVVAVALLSAPAALADLSDVVLAVGASTDRAAGSIEIMQDSVYGYWEGNSYRLEITDLLEIEANNGDLIATFGPASLISYVDPTRGRGAPAQVNLAFAVQANQGSDTSFTITSALLGNLNIANPTGRASASFTLTDASGGGATLTGQELGGFSYLTQYNGFVPGGSTFVGLIDEMQTAGGSTFEAVNYPQVGFEPIPVATVTDMSAEIGFLLSAGDTASGTTNYLVMPEPASALALILLVALRRR